MVASILPTQLAMVLPLLLLGLTAMVAFTIDAVVPERDSHYIHAGVSLVGAASALLISGWYILAGTGTPAQTVFASQLVVDTTSLLITLIVASVTLLVVLGSVDYLRTVERRGEFYSLVFLAATGMATLAHANSLPTAFVAFELTSLPSYILVAYKKHTRDAVEAGLKYFLIGAVSSAVLLYGISLIYAATGALLFPDLAVAIFGTEQAGILGLGIVLFIAGVGFKMAVVPFHFWAPDAYGSGIAPVGAFLSSASKAAGFVLAFRIFIEVFHIGQTPGIDWVLIFGVLAVVTMLLGNFAALVQSDVKRMLAYSSVGHAGYVLIALGALTTTGVGNEPLIAAGLLHLFVYGFMNTGAFLFVAVGEYWDLGRTFDDYAGLATEAPVLCAAMSVLLLNLAGIPIGGGFWSKFILFGTAIQTGFWWLAAVGAVASAVSLYYYARLLKAMWFETPADSLVVERRPTGLYAGVLAAAIVSIILLFGYGVVMEEALQAAQSLLS